MAIIVLAAAAVSSDSAVATLISPTIAANAQHLQNALVDSILRHQSFVPPSTWYLALVTQLGTAAGPGVEATGPGYARASIPASLAAWAGTQGAGTTVASTGLSGLTSNNVAVTFAAPTGAWGTVVGYEFWDALTVGNRWMSGQLQTPLVIVAGTAKAFAVGALTVSIG